MNLHGICKDKAFVYAAILLAVALGFGLGRIDATGQTETAVEEAVAEAVQETRQEVANTSVRYITTSKPLTAEQATEILAAGTSGFDGAASPPDGTVVSPTEVVVLQQLAGTPRTAVALPDSIPTSVAEALDSLVLATDRAVSVRRPIFGDPSVTYGYYDPATDAVVQQTYKVRPHPFRYGVQASAWLRYPKMRPGVEAGPYIGWRPFDAFIYAGYDGDPYVRSGVRARLGR